MLLAASDLGPDAGRVQRLGQFGSHPLDICLTVRPTSLECADNTEVRLRVEIAKREIFQLRLDLPDTESVGQRGVDLHRLLGDSLL